MRTLVLMGRFTLGVIMVFGFLVGAAQAGPCELPEFGSASFTNPLVIDNPFWPLVPGTTFVYEPVPNDDNVVNTVTVTKHTKKITVGGKSIKCRVVYDVETVDGDITEETYDWYAQDDEGNIWYFGEDTTEYLDDGTISKEGSWEAGVDGALPGYLILAEPSPGLCYQQEYYEDEAQDIAKVLRLDAEVSLETGDFFENCLVTKEWTPLESGNVEHKYYAPGTGLVLIEELKEKTVRVELIDIIYAP